MLKGREIVVGVAVASAFWVLLIVLNSDTSAYHQICETNQYSGKESCAPHHVPYVVIWYVGYWFDKVSTVITAVATGFIAVFTWTLWRSNERTTALTKKIAAIARRQMLIGQNQTVIQTQQHELEKQQFYAVHRPQLVIRAICMDEDVVPNKILMMRVPFSNQGTTKATIKSVQMLTTIVDKIEPINVGAEFKSKDISSLVPMIGGSYALLRTPLDQILSANDVFGLVQKTRFLLCVGFVQYTDEGGALHATGFARTYQPETGRFLPISDPEYEFRY